MTYNFHLVQKCGFGGVLQNCSTFATAAAKIKNLHKISLRKI